MFARTCYSTWPHHCCCWRTHTYMMSQLWSASNGDQREDKSAQNSTIEMSFCTSITCLSQCTTAIMMM